MVGKIKDILQKIKNLNNRTKISISLVILLIVASAVHLSIKRDSSDISNTAIAVSKEMKRKLPIYCVDTPDKKVAISFDAAWGNEDTPELLQILKDNDVKATFFVCGYWVKKYPEEIKMIFDAGHELGNHGDTHAHGAQLGLEENKKEIQGVHDKIKELLGVEMNLYRPPYGEYNNTVIEAADSLGYYTVQWDIESMVINLRGCVI